MLPLLPNPIDDIREGASAIAGDWLVDLAGKAGQSAQASLEQAATFWLTGVPTPQLTQSATDYAPADTVAYLWDRLDWFVSGLAVFSILVAAGKMAWERNGRPAQELLRSLLQLVLVSSAGIATISLLTTASDQTASWILQGATTNAAGDRTNFQTAFGLLISVPPITPGNAFGLVGLLALVYLASLVQMVMLIVRGGMLFLMAAVLPLAAAATNTQIGQQWMQRALGWTLAFILYKPVAAIVYATAFGLLNTDTPAISRSGEFVQVVTGLTLLVLAILALPALMRFTVPAVAAVAGGSGGGGAALSTLGALASGARPFLGGKSGSSGSRGGPKPPPPPRELSGPQGNTLPSGGQPGEGPGGGRGGGPGTGGPGTTGPAVAAAKKAGPAGAVAAGVTEGLRKAGETANTTVGDAAGEDAKGAAPAKPGPARPTPDKPGRGPSGGQSGRPVTPPTTSPPPGPPSTDPKGPGRPGSPGGPGGPSGAPQGKQNPPNSSGGPTGGRRR